MILLDPRSGLLNIGLFVSITGYVLVAWFGPERRNKALLEKNRAEPSEPPQQSKSA